MNPRELCKQPKTMTGKITEPGVKSKWMTTSKEWLYLAPWKFANDVGSANWVLLTRVSSNAIYNNEWNYFVT